MTSLRPWVICLLCLIGAGCRRAIAPPPGQAPLHISLDHLRHLMVSLTVRGRPVRAVALYAPAPDYMPTGSPTRDGSEGLASVDDAARAAVVFLRSYEATGDVQAREDALGLLAFVAAMEQGDGEWLNFVDVNGKPNDKVASGRKSMSFWGARAVWALGEAARVLGATALDTTRLRPPLDRGLARIAREIEARRLIGGSATATAEALLGVLALRRVDSSSGVTMLATRMAEQLAALASPGRWGAHVDAPGATWHAWGDRAVEALASAGAALGRPDLVRAARSEADGLWTQFLLAAHPAAAVAPNGNAAWYPQIAYGVGPIVDGFLALRDATGDDRYATLAGLTAGWFLGANDAGSPMYDTRTGRGYDGIDGPTRVNRNAGAESTVEAILALERVANDPDAAEGSVMRPLGNPALSLASVPASREYAGPDGAKLVLRRDSAGVPMIDRRVASPVTLTYWPAANPTEVGLATRLVGRWNRDHPEIQVRLQPLPAGRSSEEVLLAAIVAHATPDVCSNVSSALLARLVRAGGVVRLDGRAATAARLRERVSPAMLAPLRLGDGGVHAFPWKTNPELLMYNVEVLRAAGVAPPRTQHELLDAFERLRRDADGDGRADHWAMWAALKTTWYERFYDFYPLYLASSDGRTLVSHDSVLFENEAAVSALDVLRRGFAGGLLPRANFSVGRDPFADGTVAMKIIGPWFIRELEQIKAPGLHYDVVPVPAADGVPAERRYAFADLRSIAIFSTTRHPDAAARFVAYLTSPEADQLLIEEASQLPYRRGLADDARFARALARWPTLATYARYVGHTRDIDIDPDVVEIFDALSEAYEAGAVYGTMPVRQAVANAAAEARRIIRAR